MNNQNCILEIILIPSLLLPFDERKDINLLYHRNLLISELLLCLCLSSVLIDGQGLNTRGCG